MLKGVNDASKRIAFLVWCLVFCPAAGLLAALGNGGDGGARFLFLFLGVPAILAVVGAVAARQRGWAYIAGPLVAAALGGLSWILLVIMLANAGVFDT
jgi:hypothetical protein